MNRLKEIIQNKEYTLETILLCSPFESDSDRNLLGYFDEDLFFKGDFYAEPCIQKQIELIDKELVENNSNSKEETLQAKKSELKSQLLTIKEFESIIKKCKFSDDISYIRSFPGSGKTTYLHKLIYDNKETHNSVVIDFKSFNPELLISNSDYKETIFKTDAVDTKDTLVKLIFLLTDALNNLIIKNRFTGSNRDYKYHNYLYNLSNNFYMLFNEHEEISDLINGITPLIDKIKLFLENDNYREFIDNVVAYLTNNFKMENSKNIFFLLRLLTVLKICTLDKNNIINRNYKFIFAFDNLEYFIDQDAIYDEDILEIERILQEFLKNIERYLQNGISASNPKRNVFDGHFKFIMVIRDSTNFLRGPRHNDDKKISVLDITDAFNLNEIHAKRYNAFEKANILSETDKEIYTIIQRIMSDITPYRNSSGVSIEEMFNHNKRRITLYLYQILQDFDKRKRYMTLLNEINDNESNKEKKDIWKNASRTYIIRLLLDNIQSTKYFSDLLAIGKSGDDLGKGYARRILTYLHLKSLDDKNMYIGFYDLLHNVFDKPSHGKKSNCIKDRLFDIIATILKKLNEPEKESTKWCQLVLIRFEHRTMTKETLIIELKNAYSKRTDDINKFGIKITEAGSYYLSLLPKFEYFACRYYPNSKPLYLIENIKPNNINNITEQSFPCYKYIEKVKKQTIGYTNSNGKFVTGCIQEIFNSDINFFTSSRCRNFDDMYKRSYLYKNKGNTYGISQIKDIIVKHIGHLDGFRGFILLFNEDKLSNCDYVEREHKKILSRYILKVIEEYVEKLEGYSIQKDSSGIYYIDHYNLRNNERAVEVLLRKIKMNLVREKNKLEEGDLSFDSLFDENDE